MIFLKVSSSFCLFKFFLFFPVYPSLYLSRLWLNCCTGNNFWSAKYSWDSWTFDKLVAEMLAAIGQPIIWWLPQCSGSFHLRCQPLKLLVAFIEVVATLYYTASWWQGISCSLSLARPYSMRRWWGSLVVIHLSRRSRTIRNPFPVSLHPRFALSIRDTK